ncbi:thiazole synthase [Paenibacillus sp. IB182496]|uniref:Thiazole synthase n=1 Tax=Paenibacillus sabuli TaxID=2772509 RepID=A0A927GUI3_9BACL|nr:thiazole synthase [Paenibacillus sabuli]
MIEHDHAEVDPLRIGGASLSARFFLGTGRFPSPAIMQQALAASGAEVITFAVRRVNLDHVEDDSVLQHLEGRALRYLPNTSGASNADEAVRIAELARAAGLGNWIKVEISADPRTLLPDPLETLRATERLAALGYVTLPYTSDDPVLCRRLAEAGAAAVMPGGAPIGTGLGILNPYNLGLICSELAVPVIVDAGLGSAQDALQAMELGAAAVLANTPVARARDPVGMAQAYALAIRAGRLSYLSGRIPKRPFASASSTPEGMLGGVLGFTSGSDAAERAIAASERDAGADAPTDTAVRAPASDSGAAGLAAMGAQRGIPGTSGTPGNGSVTATAAGSVCGPGSTSERRERP